MSKLFSGTITTRYGEPDKQAYQQVIDLVEKEKIAKSRAQLLLVKRGLAHPGNPGPLVKEKVVYRDKVKEVPIEKIKTVIKEVPVEKIVYRDKIESTREHVAMDNIGVGNTSEQRRSGDKPTTRDKAVSTPSNTALEVTKSPEPDVHENNGIGWKIGAGLGVLGILAVVGIKIWQVYHP